MTKRRPTDEAAEPVENGKTKPRQDETGTLHACIVAVKQQSVMCAAFCRLLVMSLHQRIANEPTHLQQQRLRRQRISRRSSICSAFVRPPAKFILGRRRAYCLSAPIIRRGKRQEDDAFQASDEHTRDLRDEREIRRRSVRAARGRNAAEWLEPGEDVDVGKAEGSSSAPLSTAR